MVSLMPETHCWLVFFSSQRNSEFSESKNWSGKKTLMFSIQIYLVIDLIGCNQMFFQTNKQTNKRKTAPQVLINLTQWNTNNKKCFQWKQNKKNELTLCTINDFLFPGHCLFSKENKKLNLKENLMILIIIHCKHASLLLMLWNFEKENKHKMYWWIDR